MYRACIFDLDGTLCDSVESIAYCANHALRDLGMKEASLEDYKIFVGDGVDMLVRRLLRFNGEESDRQFDVLKEKYMGYFLDGCMYHVVPYPGIPEALRELKGLGAKLGVISNKPHANTLNVIEQVFGEGVFDWVQGQTKDMPRKPDPAGALYTAKKLKVLPGECLYVGDTDTDMRTGTAAGMHTVGVLWGFRDRKELEETGAKEIIAEAGMLPGIYADTQLFPDGRTGERGAL
ncbi:MAG: HAD family hydrolase [Lachnospiraceae bacterium]|uniref:HAD family hydrolase n=1 Tax=Candidatus Merdisoma sp. JLR.KK006 TaxID=3112626 RepID=UPI002FEFF3F4|nr:HAD family hydrolase [Lachnospiraceae bacterium]